MRIHVDSGHGLGYRSEGQFDFGLMADDGLCEAEICSEWATRFKVYCESLKLGVSFSKSGSVARRLGTACRRKADFLITFHMDSDTGAAPGGRVLWGTPGSWPIAETVGLALGWPADQAGDGSPLLKFNPSIEVRLGNITCWEDVKKLASEDFCLNAIRQILCGVTPFF